MTNDLEDEDSILINLDHFKGKSSASHHDKSDLFRAHLSRSEEDVGPIWSCDLYQWCHLCTCNTWSVHGLFARCRGNSNSSRSTIDGDTRTGTLSISVQWHGIVFESMSARWEGQSNYFWILLSFLCKIQQNQEIIHYFLCLLFSPFLDSWVKWNKYRMMIDYGCRWKIRLHSVFSDASVFADPYWFSTTHWRCPAVGFSHGSVYERVMELSGVLCVPVVKSLSGLGEFFDRYC